MASDKEWVKTLKVGDKVAYDRGSWYGRDYIIDEIIKITPTGIIKTNKGQAFRPDGEVRGDGWFYLQPITEEILLFLEKSKLLLSLRHFKYEELPIEKLRQINKIIKGDDIDEETSAV